MNYKNILMIFCVSITVLTIVNFFWSYLHGIESCRGGENVYWLYISKQSLSTEIGYLPRWDLSVILLRVFVNGSFWALDMLEVVLGSISVVLLYILVHLHNGEKMAIYASLLYLVSFPFVSMYADNYVHNTTIMFNFFILFILGVYATKKPFIFAGVNALNVLYLYSLGSTWCVVYVVTLIGYMVFKFVPLSDARFRKIVFGGFAVAVVYFVFLQIFGADWIISFGWWRQYFIGGSPLFVDVFPMSLKMLLYNVNVLLILLVYGVCLTMKRNDFRNDFIYYLIVFSMFCSFVIKLECLFVIPIVYFSAKAIEGKKVSDGIRIICIVGMLAFTCFGDGFSNAIPSIREEEIQFSKELNIEGNVFVDPSTASRYMLYNDINPVFRPKYVRWFLNMDAGLLAKSFKKNGIDYIIISQLDFNAFFTQKITEEEGEVIGLHIISNNPYYEPYFEIESDIILKSVYCLLYSNPDIEIFFEPYAWRNPNCWFELVAKMERDYNRIYVYRIKEDV